MCLESTERLPTLLDLDMGDWQTQVIAAVAALLGAALIGAFERYWPESQEALIGTTFVMAATGSLLLSAGDPHAGDHLTDLLAGQLLWVDSEQLAAVAAVYLPVLLLAVALMIPFIIIAEKRGKMKQIFISAIALLLMSLAGIALFATGRWGLILWLLLFFTAFNLLEASLPSLISKIAPVTSKGTAMGVYSTSQFAGAFVGGVAGGWVHHTYGLSAVFIFSALLATVWLLFALGMRAPAQLKSMLINIRHMKEEHVQIRRRLLQIEGVREVVIVEEEGVAYLKVNSATLDEEKLEAVEALGASK